MAEKEWDSRGLNVRDYWEGVEVKAGTAITTGTKVGRIVVPENSIVERVIAIIKTACTNATGTCTISAGTAVGSAAYLVASNWEAAADTVYGNAVAEVGASLKETGEGTTFSFVAAGGNIDIISIIATAVNSVEGVAMVYAHILKLEQL